MLQYGYFYLYYVSKAVKKLFYKGIVMSGDLSWVLIAFALIVTAVSINLIP
jgi:hypothetical protein